MRPALSLQRVHQVLDALLPAADAIASELGDDFPDYFDPATGVWARNGGWTEGFWAGILWWLWHYSREERRLALARHYTRLLVERKRSFSDHDLGFLFDHSAVMQFEHTGDDSLLPEARSAARRLAERFNPSGWFIRAHGALTDPDRAGYAIIDTVMNLHLLFWAARHTGEAHFYEVACATAATIGREYVREDGSTRQVVWFDPATGAVESRATLQGYAAGSCWSRGQAWAIYGFGQVYRETGDPAFLSFARRTADYFIAHMPPGGLAPYDFLDPAIPAAPADTSAQAIAAAGLLALAEMCVGEERSGCLSAAEQLLAPLCDRLAPPHPEAGRSRGFLRGGCYFRSLGRGVDSELMFGDYYLVEALMRYQAVRAWS